MSGWNRNIKKVTYMNIIMFGKNRIVQVVEVARTMKTFGKIGRRHIKHSGCFFLFNLFYFKNLFKIFSFVIYYFGISHNVSFEMTGAIVYRKINRAKKLGNFAKFFGVMTKDMLPFRNREVVLID